MLSLSGSRSSATTTLQVNDAPVTATPSSNVVGFAGQTFTAVLGSFTQYAAAPVSNFTTTVTWGDGSSSDGTVAQLPDGSFTVSGSHAYRLNGVYPIHVDIVSNGGSTGAIDTSAVIQDVPITVTADSILAVQNQLFSSEVATFTTPNQLATSDEFTATINWGDGTPTQGVSFGGSPNPLADVALVGANGVFHVYGSHTFANAPANYDVTVTVYHHSQPPAVLYAGSALKLATVSDPTPDSSAGAVGSARVLLPASGHLSPSSDSGLSNTDGITNVTQPVYTGVANPGAIINLFVNLPTADPLVGGTMVGQARVDGTGHWSIQVGTPLSDGQYIFYAKMFDSVTGGFVEATSIPSAANNAPLIVDTTGPTVENVVLNPATGVLQVTFHDGVGMNPNAVGGAGNYTFSRINGSATQPLPAGGLQLSGGPTDLSANLAYGINGGRARAARGTSKFVVDIHANAITDLAGNTLVEKTFVAFPQVSNTPNPDYIAEIDVTRGVASAPRPYVSLAEQVAAGTYSADVQRHKVVRVPHPRMGGFRRRHH